MPKKSSKLKTRIRKTRVAPEAAVEAAPPEASVEAAPPEASLEVAPPEAGPEDAPEVVFLRKILEEKFENTVHGVSVQGYHIDDKSGSPYKNGTITFQNGDKKNVSFILLDEAEGKAVSDIYTHKTNICDERVLIPRFVVYYEHSSKYIICYDQFHCPLKDWLSKWFESNSVVDKYRLPHSDIKTEIRMILKAVNNMHNRGLHHGSLFDTSNYVVTDNKWYIINVRGSLDQSDPESKLKVISDFRDFRDMLKNHVLLHPSWPERDYFFETFDITTPILNRFVPILLDHVFTKSSRDRLQMFSEINHGLRDHSPKGSLLSNAIQKGLFNQYTNGGWDKHKHHMNHVLSKIYNFSSYDGCRMESLIRFCRNVYEHYYEHSGDVNRIEAEVRNLWPGLLEKLLHYYY